MWKYSHYVVGTQTADVLGYKGFKKFMLIWGSVEPDLKLSCFLNFHSYEHWKNYVDRLFKSLEHEKCDIKFCFNLGRLLHFLCDFYTRPHTKVKFMSMLHGHSWWECRLNHLMARAFKLKPKKSSLIYSQHRRNYLHSDKTVSNDLKYINEICNFIVFKFLKK